MCAVYGRPAGYEEFVGLRLHLREERIRRAEEVRLGVEAVDAERREAWFSALADDPRFGRWEWLEHSRAVQHRNAVANRGSFGMG